MARFYTESEVELMRDTLDRLAREADDPEAKAIASDAIRRLDDPEAGDGGRPPLTARQREVLDVIRRRRRETGIPPTVRELMEMIGVNSPNGVMCHIQSLRRKGYLVQPDGAGAKSHSFLPV